MMLIVVVVVVVAIVLLIFGVLLPKITRDRHDQERMARDRMTPMQRAFVDANPLNSASAQENERKARLGDLYGLLYLLPVPCSLVLLLFLWGWLDDVGARLLINRAQELWILYRALWLAAAVGVLALVGLYLRLAKGLTDVQWWKKLGAQSFLICFAILWLAMILNSAIQIIFLRTAKTPETILATVVRSGVHRSSKGTTWDYATVETSTGERLELMSYHSFFSFITGYALRVNGHCKLDTLPKNLHVVLQGRRSDHGFALDEVTSQEPCAASK